LPKHKTGISEPLRALKHRGLLIMSLSALCYNWAFFTVLGYAPFPMKLGAIQLGLVFTGWGLLVALFAVFGAPWLQRRLGIARTLYANLALFAVVVLVIAIWTTHQAVLIVAVIIAGVFIGVNNTVTTQAVMTVSPVERPVASAAYGFVRFIGGGLAPFAAGKLVEATNIHVPFYIGAGALVLAIAILATGHKMLGEAERVQAEASGAVPEAEEAVLVTVARSDESRPDEDADADLHADGHGAIVAAIGDSPMATAVAEAAGRLATLRGRPVHVLHALESAVTSEGSTGSEDEEAAAATVRACVEKLSAQGVPALGKVLRGAADHGEAGRIVAEHANRTGARAIVIGAPSHGGLPALVDGDASRALWENARCDIVMINPVTTTEGAPTAG
ncbi:MAG TPA: MFS transporter, partial [Streptomyces sp.]|nr:MFS transporter [Streptomyces sp.]